MILIKMNLACNFRCKYCYQNPIRNTKELPLWQSEKVLDTIKNLYKKTKSQIVLHGGEPLILPKYVIEKFLKLSYDLSGRSSIQTNGYLVDDDIIQLFKKYKTSVGLSIDGPYPCNELRGIGSSEDRRKQTEKIIKNLFKLQKSGIPTSVIIVLHKYNGLNERREILKDFLLKLNKEGITGRLNLCCCDNENIDLTPEEAREVYLDLLEFCIEHEILGWSPFRDLTNSLIGNKNVVCIFRECDPYCTPAATSILYDGSLGVCLKLYHDGEIYLRDRKILSIRSQILKETDCKGCEYWEHCYGGCPGMAIDHDWRRKDRFCEAYKAILKRLSKILKFINICRPQVAIPTKRRKEIEHIDGNIKHLDSNLLTYRGHSDGIEHIDGSVRHLDSG